MKVRTWFVVAVCLLACYGCSRKKSTDDMIGDLTAPHESDRIAAVRTLAQRQGEAEQVVPALIQALKDKSAEVRRDSAIGLGSFGERAREAIPALRDAAEHDHDVRVRHAADVALGRIDPSVAHESPPPEKH